MKAFLLAATATFGTAAALLFVYVRQSRESRTPAPVILVGESHRVSDAMKTASDKASGRSAPPFRLEGADGETYALEDLVKDGPLVLVFIKDGCPCSVEAQPYFDQVHAGFRGHVRFLGVIEGDAVLAMRWGEEHAVAFPILADPGGKVIRAYGAENSAYVAVIERGGRLERLWPGYSADMLKEFAAQLARLSGRPEPAIDVADAPAQMYSGCPFD